MNMNQVSVIIPALNEEEAIADVISQLKESCSDVELIVVDDGSTDRTREIAQAEGVRVVHHGTPKGYGAALRAGIQASTREYVLCCDGDGQHTAEDVCHLIQEIDGYDMVVGKRDENSHATLSRRPGKWVLKRFGNYLLQQKIPDLNSGLRIFKKETLMRYIHLMPTGFSFSTTSTFAMFKTGQAVKYVPITVQARLGTSSVRQVRHGFETIMLMLRLTCLFEPLRVFLTFTGFLFAFTIISFLIDVCAGESGLGDTTVLLAIATLLVFLFGLLCDQVSAIRRQLHE